MSKTQPKNTLEFWRSKLHVNSNGVFSFSEVSLKIIEAENSLLKLNKVSQYSDITIEIIYESSIFKLHF